MTRLAQRHGPKRIAVVLFNLGGPDGPTAVRPFLKNLFSDPAIIARAGAGCAGPLAALISRAARRRRRDANYAVMGGASPLLAETQAQAEALRRELGGAVPADEIRSSSPCATGARSTEAAAAEVAAFAPDEVVLLPLYPQFSTTTTASSLAAWQRGLSRRRPRARGLLLLR